LIDRRNDKVIINSQIDLLLHFGLGADICSKRQEIVRILERCEWYNSYHLGKRPFFSNTFFSQKIYLWILKKQTLQFRDWGKI